MSAKVGNMLITPCLLPLKLQIVLYKEMWKFCVGKQFEFQHLNMYIL